MESRRPRWLPRPALERRLDAALTHRLTTLVAASGYGKTALLERWATEVGAVGHRLTAEDDHLVHLVRRVLSALRLRVPQLSTQLSDALAAPLGPGTDTSAAERAVALAGGLCEALATTLRRDLVLILDDVDVLDPEGPSTAFVDALLRAAPHRLHLVTASRTPPPFPVDRLRAQGQVLELTARDLTVGVRKVREWATALLGEDGAELAEDVMARAGGWPVAVVTSLEQLAGTPPELRRKQLAAAAPAPVVEDLVLERYDAQPPAVRELLSLGTVADLLDRDLAGALDLPGESLEPLHLSGTLLDDDGLYERYRLTPVARAALARHRPLDPDRARELGTAAARWYADHDESELALRTLRRIDDPDALAGLLTSEEPALETATTASEVLAAVAALPPGTATAPAIRRLAGMAHQAHGDWDTALDLLTEVADTDAFDATVAWRLGLIHHLRGQLDIALEIYERGTEVADPPVDGAICAAWAASARWLRGERDACAALADEAMARATALDEPRALAAAHMVLAMLAALDGDRRGNDAHYLRAIEHAERAGDVLQLIRIRSNRASHHLEEGAFADALAEVEVARHLAELAGFTPFMALTLSNRAEALVGVGRLEEAVVDAADAVAAWRALGSRLVVYGLEEQARIQRLRGDVAGAVATYREVLAEADATGEVQGLVPSLAKLAELLHPDDPEEAEALIGRALGAGEGMGYVAARVSAARLALATDERARARTYLHEARRAAAERRDRPALAMITELEAVLDTDPATAEAAVEQWRDIGDVIGQAGAELTRAELLGGPTAVETATAVRSRMQGLGCRLYDQRVHALLAADAGASPTVVSIETLGAFRVLRDGVPVPRTAWQSRKARELVKLLVARRGRPTAREWLAERLWPDTEAATAAKRLNVMASTVRTIIDPDRALPADHVLVSERDTLQLDLRHVTVDVEELFREVDRASRLDQEGHHEEALVAWRSAERRYRGDFCEDEVYADWAVGVREEARAAYAQAVARLAEDATAAGRHDEAVRFWLRLLERDPYDERAHLALVTSLLAAGRRGEARRRYQTYVERARELGVEPTAFATT
jgi:ATP/maltotriose-dependent transcriptional regulator MalT/DNA-binding SARP family transcriptional activator